ncbi:YdeI/OmpD-associated family protein [Falsiroseomonas oryzae]|uniref:YdeI/OmpD-associated family protein n=1 Tax=Falsiroseomonas oryzae TaxID=2766473 RepID=UPI0022EB2573|nr:YdeI/OmpD-associated family protein [Roseomonas sp. MO-31]
MAKRPAEHAERVEPESRAAWRAWLAANHARPAPVWLVIAKDGTRDLDAVGACEEALCFGWIDSLPRKLDATRWMLLVSPRKPGSPWSRVNKARIERLRAAGLMAPPGEARIAAAKADGSWDSYEVAESLAEPPDLAAALDAVPGAAAAWGGFAPSARKGILWWVAAARTPATRARRVAETARLAALGLRANFPESRGR